MNYASLKDKILGIEIGQRQNVYSTAKDVVVFVNKPIKVPTRLKQSKMYDIKKNFQIGLSKGGQKEFLPNEIDKLLWSSTRHPPRKLYRTNQ